ncbi:hypothetical protein E2562_009313 [Oryza meyeriana var. granulata]|uniref:Uncharacterized protein n=1 Tax=Oryza meyeriana var. granulata TaxID=110450 RepID=A0A6G1CDK0_9ORYZ|nr:hypothetical protein E2562_009313 [Oryza meyeriana var. granulata]
METRGRRPERGPSSGGPATDIMTRTRGSVGGPYRRGHHLPPRALQVALGITLIHAARSMQWLMAMASGVIAIVHVIRTCRLWFDRLPDHPQRLPAKAPCHDDQGVHHPAVPRRVAGSPSMQAPRNPQLTRRRTELAIQQARPVLEQPQTVRPSGERIYATATGVEPLAQDEAGAQIKAPW